MGRKIFLTVSIVCIALFIYFSGIKGIDMKGIFDNKAVNQTNKVQDGSNHSNKYTLDIQLDEGKNVLYGKEKVVFVNNSNAELNEVYFHIYPSAFASRDTAPVLFSSTKYAYPKGFKPCCITIENIHVNNKEASSTVEGIDNTLLRINLAKTLKHGKTVEIDMDFRMQIPEMRERIGYFNGTYNFGNWYPIAAVYDENGWNLDLFYNVGDPFYSEIGDYDVKISLPARYKVASTGSVESEKAQNGIRYINITASNVRDFAWVASTKFKVYEKVVDDINVKCYVISANTSRCEKALQSAENAIKIYNKYFGKYPYENYSIVQTHFSAGMEYPGLAYIAEDYFSNGKTFTSLESMIAHETAHQWWYGVVGNDEVDEAWLDESFATYSKRIYFEMRYGESTGKDFYDKNILGKYKSKRSSIKGKEIILRKLPEFIGWSDYGPLAYEKGAVMLQNIRDEVGDKKFFEILETYFDNYKFKNADTEAFIDIVESTTGKDWDAFFDKWLLDKKPLE